MIISLICYLIITVLAGSLLSFFIIISRSAGKRGDSTPFPTIIICLLITILGPFIYVELLTKAATKELQIPIMNAYRDGPINGKFKYFRVLTKFGDHARAIAVGEERTNWGGTDRPVMSIELKKKNGKWAYESYNLLYSDRKNEDHVILPPYR
ncbi:hypothetical protein BH11ARM1_BH11ARM1_11860 [soil metagenome]